MRTVVDAGRGAGPRPGARTSDVLRLWYADHPAELKRRVRYYPNGPLADLYHRGRRGKYLRCRYDSIRVSPGISVTDVRYLYEEAVRVGSDHALVVADVELTYRGRSMSRKKRYDQSAMPLLRRV